MDNLSFFLNENKIKQDNIFYAVSDSFKNDKGESILWELRAVSTEEEAEIRASAMVFDGERTRLDMNKYMAGVISRAVVFPNLFDAKLQDSYNVKTPEALLTAMVDKPGEYSRLGDIVQKLNGFTSFREDIDKAKN